MFNIDLGPFTDSIKNIFSTGAVLFEALGKFLVEVIKFMVDLLKAISEKF